MMLNLYYHHIYICPYDGIINISFVFGKIIQGKRRLTYHGHSKVSSDVLDPEGSIPPRGRGIFKEEGSVRQSR
jgi:hypothetical protein